MHRAIFISSQYPAASGYPNHACWAGTAEPLAVRLAEQGYEVQTLNAGSGLVERLRAALRHEDKQTSLLLHFSGYLLLTESGEPALLLADEGVTALRLTQLLERSARRFGRVLLVVDAVRGSSTRTIARASGDARRAPEDALAKMAVACAKQADNVTMLVAVRPWGDDGEDDSYAGQLTQQLNQALRQLATIPDWHSSRDLEDWLEDHADQATFVLHTYHCDPSFPLFPRRPYPSSPHAPPLPKTLGPGEDAPAEPTSLDELAAMIREPRQPAPAVTANGRARAKVQVLPSVTPPSATSDKAAAPALPPSSSAAAPPAAAPGFADNTAVVLPPAPPAPGPAESTTAVLPPPAAAPAAAAPGATANTTAAPPPAPAAPVLPPPAAPPPAAPSPTDDAMAALPPAPAAPPPAPTSALPHAAAFAAAPQAELPSLPPAPLPPPTRAAAPQAAPAEPPPVVVATPAIVPPPVLPPREPTSVPAPQTEPASLPFSVTLVASTPASTNGATEATGTASSPPATPDLPEPPVLLPPAPPAQAHRSGPPATKAVSVPPPLPLERAQSTQGPPPLPAERSPQAALPPPGDTRVSAVDPVPPAPPLPISITGPEAEPARTSTLISAGSSDSTGLPQRSASALGSAAAQLVAAPPPPPPSPVGAPQTAASATLASVPPPGGLPPAGATQVSAGPSPPVVPPTRAKTTPVVVLAPPSVPPPPPTLSNTVETAAVSFPAPHPPSLPPPVTSPESWPPNVHTSQRPSRDEAAVVANAQRALAMGQSEEALRLAEECLRHFPHSVPAMQLAATELARLGRWARLADLYERVIGQLQHPASAAQLCGALARICSAQLHDPVRAEQAIVRGLSLHPDHPSLLAELAAQEERRGNWKLAAEYSRRGLRNAPLDARLCREALRRFHQTGQLDLAWNAACVLGYLGQANEQERSFVNARRGGNLPQPKRALNGADFQLGLTPTRPAAPLHQVLTKLYAPLRQATLPKPKQQQQLLATVQREDVRQSTTTLARTFVWSCQLLDISPPALYLASGDALPRMLTVDEPAWCVGRTIGRGLSLLELAFLWARALVRTRPETRIATCVSSPAELQQALEAAALLAEVSSGSRASSQAKKLSKVLKRHADKSLWHELRAPLQALMTSPLDETILRWHEDLERAANRLGLLACGDPELAARTLTRYADESVLDRQAQLSDLLGFTMSDEYEALTSRILGG